MTGRGRSPNRSCRDATERLLEADLSSLRGEDRTPLAAHIRACPSCRDAAQAILAAERGLGRALDGLRPSIEATEAVSLAERGRADAGDERRDATGSRVSRRRLWPLVPLAAAAVAGLLLWGPRGGPEPRRVGLTSTASIDEAGKAPGPDGARGPEISGRFALDVPERGRAIVFGTRDPTITVVWLYR